MNEQELKWLEPPPMPQWVIDEIRSLHDVAYSCGPCGLKGYNISGDKAFIDNHMTFVHPPAPRNMYDAAKAERAGAFMRKSFADGYTDDVLDGVHSEHDQAWSIAASFENHEVLRSMRGLHEFWGIK